MKIKGYSLNQGKGVFYVGVMKVKDLVNVGRVDTFSASHEEGYQRSLSMARARAFGRYVLTNHLSPLSILLNVREQNVKPSSEGTLTFPDGIQMWVVDGQHRLAGLRFALEQDPNIGEIEFPVVIMNEPNDYQEAWQFITINKTQKGVRTDLAERFLNQALKIEGRKALLDLRETGVMRGILRDVEWIGKALDVADIINKEKSHPWYMKIRLPNEPKNGTIVSQKAFTDSLEPILKDSFFQGKEANAIAPALINYWDAIWELCEEAFANPNKYVIQKTTGVFVLHKVFPRVSELCRDEYGNRVLTTEKIKSVLERSQMMSSDYWAGEGEAGKRGTSRKAFASLIMEFLEDLESSQPTKQPDLVT
jgi:DGQHR domain-containing protein